MPTHEKDLEDDDRQPKGVVVDGSVHLFKGLSLQFRRSVFQLSDATSERLTAAHILERITVNDGDQSFLINQRPRLVMSPITAPRLFMLATARAKLRATRTKNRKVASGNSVFRSPGVQSWCISFAPTAFRIVNPAKAPLAVTVSRGKATKGVRSCSLSAIIAFTLPRRTSSFPSVYILIAIELSPSTWNILASPPFPRTLPSCRRRPEEVMNAALGFTTAHQGSETYRRRWRRRPSRCQDSRANA